MTMVVVAVAVDAVARWLCGLGRQCVAMMAGGVDLLFPDFTLR